MGPLADLPAGHPHRNGGLKGAHQLSYTGQEGHSGATGLEASSIKAMLKNSTEVGDAVHFSPKHAYKPSSNLKGGLRTDAPVISSPSNILRFERHPRQLSNNNAGAMPTPMPPHARHRSRKNEPEDGTVEEYRSWSMTQKSYVTQTFNRHPNQTVMYQSRGVGPTGRPRSPYAYPTRLKRPGYRPSSPAANDPHQPGFVSLPGSRPASPASSISTNWGPPLWPQPVSHSDPTLLHYPPFLAQGGLTERRPSPALSQASTSRPTPSLRSTASSSRLRGPPRSTSNLKPNADSVASTPRYYDYTEGFEDDHQYQTRDRLASITPKDLQVDELAAHHFKDCRVETNLIVPASNSGPSPIQSNDHNSSVKASNADRMVHVQAANHTPKYYDEAVKSVIRSMPTPSRQSNQGLTECSDIQAPHHGAEFASQPYTNLNEASASMSSLKALSRGTDTNLSIIRRYADSASSSIGSVQTAESKPAHEQISSRSRIGWPEDSLHQERSDKEDFEPRDTIAKSSSASEDVSLSEPTEIVSPTPERSVMSVTSRHRFSKILGLDERSYEHMRHPNDTKNSTDISSMPSIKERKSVSTSHNNSIKEDTESDEAIPLSPSLIQVFGTKADLTPTNGVSSSESQSNLKQEEQANGDPDIKASTEASVHFHEALVEAIRTSNRDSDCSSQNIAAVTAEHFQSKLPTLSKATKILGSGNPPYPTNKFFRSIVAIAPPTNADARASLPFAFKPLNHDISEQESSTELDDILHISTLSPNNVTQNLISQRQKNQDQHDGADRASITSSHASRPWNRNSNYPWNDKTLDLDVALPDQREKTPSPVSRFPRFKLRVHRASTSTTGTGRLTKSRTSSEVFGSSKRNSGHFLTQSSILKTKSKQQLPIGPGQLNSSHAIGSDHLQSQFAESLDKAPQLDTVIASSAITLLPPSPGHESRSFFSDDSSQFKQKGSLRKRLSQFKARHSQSNSTEDVRGFDRGLLSSAFGRSRTSGRTSRQSQNTAGTSSYKSNVKRMHTRFFRNVIFWWRRNVKTRFSNRQNTDHGDLAASYSGT